MGHCGWRWCRREGRGGLRNTVKTSQLSFLLSTPRCVTSKWSKAQGRMTLSSETKLIKGKLQRINKKTRKSWVDDTGQSRGAKGTTSKDDPRKQRTARGETLLCFLLALTYLTHLSSLPLLLAPLCCPPEKQFAETIKRGKKTTDDVTSVDKATAAAAESLSHADSAALQRRRYQKRENCQKQEGLKGGSVQGKVSAKNKSH